MKKVTCTAFIALITMAASIGISTDLNAAQGPIEPTIGEGFVNPLGFHDETPTFSWKLPAGSKKQSAYHIKVSDTSTGQVIWDSDWVESAQSVLVPYGGSALKSRQKISWQVRFKDEAGEVSDWSEAASAELGLLDGSDWSASWIRPTEELPEKEEPVSLLRRDFTLEKGVKEARLYVTSRGIYEIHLNGEKVGNDALAPGWTPFKERLDTVTYDVTELLESGDNAIGAMLGTGWYAGKMGWEGNFAFYGKNPELLLQLEVTHADGSVTTVTSDADWKATFSGPIVAASLYDGETYDARREIPGWSAAGFDDASWQAVVANSELGEAELGPKPLPPVNVTEVLDTRKISEPEPGRFVFDLGQNMVGWPLLEIPVVEGQQVTIRFAEMLNADGTLYNENYRSAKSINFYTPAVTGTVTWKPRFTFHGFRYVELSGLAADAKPERSWVKGLVLHSDLRRLGHFASSHEKLNQLQSNIVWGQRGNFVDIPTDCPQRDERMGWTGDAQVFGPTSMFNYDSHAFWKSWLHAMRLEQFDSGKVPCVIPAVFIGPDSPGWMDAATIIPWDAYVRTGDTEFLADNYEMMANLVAFYRGKAEGGVITKISGFGDWLQPYAKNRRGETPIELLGTAFYANSVAILVKSAEVLGKAQDAAKYRAELEGIKSGFAAKYFDEEWRLTTTPDTQTAYLLAIAFELIPEDAYPQAAKYLVALIEEAGGHLRTGFLGTPFITRVLDQMNYDDLAFSILFKESYPSWFYSINQGATTMWERWNSYSHEDGFGDVSMNSFNHYAYGAIGQWMYERVAGLAPDPENPGYQHFFAQPLVGGPLTFARAELETPYGKAVSGWKIDGSNIHVEVTVPPNTTATLVSPVDGSHESLEPGTHKRVYQQ